MNGYRNDAFDRSTELDIYIPSIKVGIEYDGTAWHDNKTNLARDRKKYEICIRLSQFYFDKFSNSFSLDYWIYNTLGKIYGDLKMIEESKEMLVALITFKMSVA